MHLDDELFYSHNWKLATYIAQKVKEKDLLEIPSNHARNNGKQQNTINVETKLQKRTKQQIHNIDINVSFNNCSKIISCQSDNTAEDLLSKSIEAFQISQSESHHKFDLFLQFGSSK